MKDSRLFIPSKQLFSKVNPISRFDPWCLLSFSAEKKLLFGDIALDRLSAVPVEIGRELTSEGFRFWDSDPPTDLIKRAALWIDKEPKLGSICANLVEQLHLIRAEPGYDVSHSEPRWRRRIFCSIPERTDSIGALRLAESIVHETMHLHLTDFEDSEPLVQEFNRKLGSPWKAEPRSYQGVMHGLFVFTCLGQYFSNLLTGQKDDEATHDHCRQRIIEIADEIDQIDVEELASGLTGQGAALVRRWSKLSKDIRQTRFDR